jgi:hypothetical protein
LSTTSRDEHFHLLAEAAGASGYQAFATYAAGEVALPESPETGIDLLRGAAAQADSTGATQVITVARIALVSALTRLGRHGEAQALFPRCCTRPAAKATGPSCGQRCASSPNSSRALGRQETAAVLLAAARQSPSAPAVSGEDVERYRQLEELISRRTGPDVLEQITALARALPRTQVVDRALAALDGLAS